MSALIKFEWQRDSAGYHVEKRKGLRLVHAFDGEVKVEEFVFLSEVNEPWSPVSWDGSESDIEEIEVIVPNGGPLLTYYPLEEEPSLFAILAATKLNSDSVLTFVNRFGPLHHGRTSMFVEYWDSDIKNTSNFISAIEGKNYQIITDYFCNDWASGLRVRFDYTTGRSKPQLCLTPPDLR
ncbi:MAG: hypothetical protein O2826_09010, partial [Chloroflexi bacterium]|nr:hypothetical protein [Chloroflexota bacterium]